MRTSERREDEVKGGKEKKERFGFLSSLFFSHLNCHPRMLEISQNEGADKSEIPTSSAYFETT